MRPAQWSARAALVLLGVLAMSTGAAAETRASSLQVSAQIAPTCRLSGPGTDTHGIGSPGAGDSTIALICTKGVSAIVASQRPGERAAILRSTSATTPARSTIDRRPPVAHSATAAPGNAPLITTIQF